MKLEYFIMAFSHNNVIRLVTEHEGGHKTVADSWAEVSMDWEILQGKGIFSDYAKNYVTGLANIGGAHPQAINIVIQL